MTQYEDYYRDRRGATPEAIRVELARVVRFLGRDRGPLPQLDPEAAAALYRDLQQRKHAVTGKPISVSEQHNSVKAAQRFGRWLVKEGLWRATPLDGLELEGRAKAGEESKPQLTMDQARLWLDGAVAMAVDGDQGALAAALCLVMGCRAGEAVGRRCSDVDDGGAHLRIGKGKTRTSRRGLRIPEVLQAAVQQQVAAARAWSRAQEVPQLDPWLFPPLEHRPGPRAAGEHLSVRCVRQAVHRVCRAIGLPLVCSHALRGTFASVGVEQGVAVEAVAKALGHASTATTRHHYATAAAQAAGEQWRRAKAVEPRRRQPEEVQLLPIEVEARRRRVDRERQHRLRMDRLTLKKMAAQDMRRLRSERLARKRAAAQEKRAHFESRREEGLRRFAEGERQKDIAAALGVSPQAVSVWVRDAVRAQTEGAQAEGAQGRRLRVLGEET